MKKQHMNDQLAVCSWSLRPADPGELIRLMKDIGINKVQLDLGPTVYDKKWARAGEELADEGIRIVSGMFGTKDEDYTSLDSIRLTGGVVPDRTWKDNWKHIRKVIPVARSLGLNLVTFHAGFLPESPSDPAYEKLADRLRTIAEAFGSEGIELAFETGQEDASTLKRFLEHLDASNVGVNFDPANMILYGMGDPVDSVKTLMKHVKQVHVKDALPAKTPGVWGEEVVVGTGAVDWNVFFGALEDGGFSGYMSIEREAGENRVRDIIEAKRFVLGK